MREQIPGVRVASQHPNEQDVGFTGILQSLKDAAICTRDTSVFSNRRL